jgi:hypothetical protein
MDKIPGLLLLILFSGAGLISTFAIINLLLPIPVERTRASLENLLGRSLLLGLVNFLFAVVIAALLIWPTRVGGIVAGIFAFLAGSVVLAVIVLTLLGLVAATSLLGSRTGETKSPVTSHLRGGVLLLLACLTPYLGWFIVTPLVLWTAFGAAIQALFRRKEKAA